MTFLAAIKFCGITELDDARFAVDLGVQYLGLNFYERSARRIDRERAAAIVASVPKTVTCVGVFVNATREHIAETIQATGIHAIQLHGDESPELCAGWSCVQVLKAFRVDESGVTYPPLSPYLDVVSFLLLDRYSPHAYGGTGEAIDRAALRRAIPGPALGRAFLAGGLTPENVGELVRSIHPFGVDVAGGIEEGTPGKKSAMKMKQFVDAVQRAESEESE